MNFDFLSFLSGMFGLKLVEYLNLEYNYNHLFAENVSKSRMQWIDNFREELGIFLGCARVLAELKCNVNENQVICFEKSYKLVEAEKARVKLLTRLNLDTTKHGNEYNSVFAECLRNINLFDIKSVDMDGEYDKLISLSRKILEAEWQRVKKEAQGKKMESEV